MFYLLEKKPSILYFLWVVNIVVKFYVSFSPFYNVYSVTHLNDYFIFSLQEKGNRMMIGQMAKNKTGDHVTFV